LKNLKYFPFERNRYFYGKLLTVSDFETEQKYLNDKRRLLNRFLHGSGVVCGMNVVRVDDTTISVEMGVALDFSGREIVVDTPAIKRLAMIEGFDSDLESDSGYMYLCVDYAEAGRENVHSMTSSGAQASEDMEHNKIGETYRLFLTGNEPDNEGFTTEHFYRDTQTVYWGKGVRVKQVLPRFSSSGGVAELKIIVENMGQQQPFGFSYDLDLTCLQVEERSHLTVNFHERDFTRATRYELSFPLRVASVQDTDGVAVVQPESFHLVIGDKDTAEAVAAAANHTAITARSAKRELMARYYRTAMEEIVKNTYQQSIYLAKIRIIKAGPAYVIEDIENMPFRQYVFNNALASALNDIAIDEIAALENAGGTGETDTGRGSGGGRQLPTHTVATGTVTLDLGVGGAEGQRFFSEEIAHGLGLGPVHITLSEAYTLSDDSDLLFGSPEVFEDVNGMYIANVQLAARVNTAKGAFVVGARVVTPTAARSLKINWMATRDAKENIHDLEIKRIFIKPDLANVEVRGTCYFEALFANITDQRIKWRVKEAEGGTIDNNGMYTAPNTPGVYEIIAESPAHPELSASTYVVVRENTPAAD
jgi:hypothetical protein